MRSGNFAANDIVCADVEQVWTDDADVEIIPNDQGNRVTPSYVAFTESERLIGDAAKNQAALNPQNTIFDAKYFYNFYVWC